MIICSLRRSNGDTAHVRTCGKFEYVADVTTSAGRNDNANWPERYVTPRACREALERHGFKIAE